MLGCLAKHDLRTVFQWKSRDSGANRRKCDGLQSAFIGDPQRMGRGMPQRVGTGLPTELHAGRMNHESRLQFSARGDGRIADRDTADGIAFALDLFSAFAANGSSNARTKDQIVVGRVDDRVRIHLRQVALLNDDSLCEWFHRGINPFSLVRSYLCFCSFLLPVVINAAPRLAPKPSFLNVLPQQGIGPVLFAKGLMEILENLEPYVQTDEIDQLEGA